MTRLDNYPSKKARPVFILSSGRSGTAMLTKLLSACKEVEMHHEYLCTHIQSIAVRYYMGLVGPQTVKSAITRLHGTALLYARKPIWGDSSNKLSWIADVLAETFPDARFVFLTRDGRKVVSSYYHKLRDECYDDYSVRSLIGHLDAPDVFPPPPPEKRFWWPAPLDEPDRMEAFRAYSQFDRIAFHWGEINRVIMGHLYQIDADRQFRVKLEDLTTDPSLMLELFRFIGVPERPQLFKLLERPHNVKVPVDKSLTPGEEKRFFELNADVMKALGYFQNRAYTVDYGVPAE
ncbi:MAG: sulfotransferase [Pseudomonadota bacterium]